MSQSMIFSRVMFGSESTYGTAVTRDTVVPKAQGLVPARVFNRSYGRGLGEGLSIVTTSNISYDSSGNGSLFMTSETFDFLAHFVGPVSGSGTAVTPYVVTEASVVSPSDLASFSCEMSNAHTGDTSGILFSGCVGNSLGFSGSVGSELGVDFSFVAQKDVHLASPTSYTPSTVDPFVMIGGVFKYGSGLPSLTGVRAFNIDYSNGILSGDDVRDLDTIFPSQPELSSRGYTGSVSVKMTSGLASTILVDFYGQTATSGPKDTATPTAGIDLEFLFSRGSERFSINLDECVIDSIDEPSDIGGGLVILTYNFTARKGTDNKPFRSWSV